MLVCVPTSNDAGLKGVIHEHFGSAPFFTLIDTDNQNIEIIQNRNSHHSHGTCHPMTQLSRYKIDAVVCSGMGRRAVEALNSEGIRTLIANGRTVKDAIDRINDGSAVDIDAARACHGHGQHQQHDHVHEHFGPGFGQGQGQGRTTGRGTGRGTGGGRGFGRK